MIKCHFARLRVRRVFGLLCFFLAAIARADIQRSWLNFMQFNYFLFFAQRQREMDRVVSAPLFLLRLKADGRIQHLRVHREKYLLASIQ